MPGLGAVAIGIEEESAVVVIAVFRPRAGSAVVAVAAFRSRPPERVDKLARSRAEADVKVARDGVIVVGGRERELPLPDGVLLVSPRALDPDRPQHGVVEALGRLAVGHADRDV